MKKSKKSLTIIIPTVIILVLATISVYVVGVRLPCKKVNEKPPLLPTIDFIQSWYARTLTDEKWDDYMSELKKSGVESVILQSVMTDYNDGVLLFFNDDNFFGDKRYSYTLEKMLSSADRHGVGVYIGTYCPDDWWTTDYNDKYVTDLANAHKGIIKSVAEKYLTHSSVKGWYFSPEFYYNVKGYEDNWAKLLNLTIDCIRQYGNDLPLIFSPFYDKPAFAGIIASESIKKLINGVNFRQGDVFAPQDGFGKLGKNVSDIELGLEYGFVKACADAVKNSNVSLWLNCELFTSEEDEKASYDRMLKQFKISGAFSEKTLCFSFSHYAVKDDDKTLYNDFNRIVDEYSPAK